MVSQRAQTQPPTQPQTRVVRRDLLGLFAGACLFAGAVPSCGPPAPALTVKRPLGESLSGKSLSLQFTFERSFMGPISPNGRYAKRMRPRLKNALIQTGFVLKQETADLHLRVHLQRITTGGTAHTAECALQVFLYDKWPGDLSAEMKKRDPQFPEPRMELAIHVVVKEITQGYQRETLAQVAAQDALDELVAYLIGLRATT